MEREEYNLCLDTNGSFYVQPQSLKHGRTVVYNVPPTHTIVWFEWGEHGTNLDSVEIVYWSDSYNRCWRKRLKLGLSTKYLYAMPTLQCF